MNEMLLREGVAYHGRKREPFTGQANEYFPFKKDPQPIKAIRNFKDGKLHGTTTFFYNNGQKSSEIHYENGVREGIATNWFMTGEIKWVRSFKQNALDGEAITYNQMGEILTHLIYSKGAVVKAIQ